MQRDYKVRVPADVAEATSANVTAWIEQALASDGKLDADPGAGPATIALRLDSEKLLELANRKRERVPVVLRRLIASHVNLPHAEEETKGKSAGAAAAELLPEKVLPRKLAYTTEDLLSVVKTLDKGLAFAYRRVYGLKDLAPGETAAEDRDLASAMAECANRRSPKWLLENADLAKLTFSLVRWTMAQTDQLDKNVEETKEARPQLAVVASRETAAAPAADSPEAFPERTRPPEPADIEGAIDEPVQVEGEF
jgi:hypothetical protein